MKITVVSGVLLFLCVGIILSEADAQVLPMLRSSPDTVHPVSLGFSSRSVLPWFGTNEPPALFVTGHGSYFENRHLIYRAAGKDGRGEFCSLPADYPVYDKGSPFETLPPSGYLAVPREDGLFDVVSPGKWLYHVNSGRPGVPVFNGSYTVEFKEQVKDGRPWVADVTGDGIPDLLIGGMLHKGLRFNMYPDYPDVKGPWFGGEHPNMGALPDTDIQNFRGYDIAGNWLASPTRKYLWWAKGALDKDGRLGFGEFKQVRYGETDYPVQWQTYNSLMSPVVMDLEGTRYIILFSDSTQAYALPLRAESDDGELRTGKAEPLLAEPMVSVNLPMVYGLGDLNMDGRAEIIIGSGANGRFSVMAGTRPGDFKDMGNIFCKGGLIAGDTLTVPVRVDWTGDGYPDIILGDASGILSLWAGTSDPLVYGKYQNFKTPSGWIRHRPTDGNLQGSHEDAWSYIQPAVYDWDGDGLLDIITNDNEAKLFLYRGKGPGTELEERQRFMLVDKPLPVAWRVRVAPIDGTYGLAGDDRPCLLMVTWDNKLAYAVPEKKGSLNFEQIVEIQDEEGNAISMSGPAGFSGRLKLSIVDWDNDGTWDIVVGCQKSLQRFFRTEERHAPSAAPFWLRNIGTNDRPVFDRPRLITFKDGTPIKVNNHNFNVWPTDLDGDGLPDIIFGDDEGFIFYLYRKDLTWNENIAKEQEVKKRVTTASVAAAVYASGQTVFMEDWNYSAQPVSSELRSGEGWAEGWQVSGESAEVMDARISSSWGVFADAAEKGYLALSGKGKSTASVKRQLLRPVSFNPDKETVFNFTLDYARIDKTNNTGSEGTGLFILSAADGPVLCSVGMNSDEAIELKLGAETATSDKDRLKFSGSYGVQGRLILRPAGEKDELLVKFNEKKPDADSSSDWDLRVAADVGGDAWLFQQSIGKFAGTLYADNLIMRAE